MVLGTVRCCPAPDSSLRGPFHCGRSSLCYPIPRVGLLLQGGLWADPRITESIVCGLAACGAGFCGQLTLTLTTGGHELCLNISLGPVCSPAVAVSLS